MCCSQIFDSLSWGPFHWWKYRFFNKFRANPCERTAADDVFIEHGFERQSKENVVLHCAAYDPGLLRRVADTANHFLGPLHDYHLVTQTTQQRRLQQKPTRRFAQLLIQSTLQILRLHNFIILELTTSWFN